MLNAMRFGVLDPQTIQAFRDLARPLTYTDGIGPTEMYPYTPLEVRFNSCLAIATLLDLRLKMLTQAD